jgi:hypothetical protein
MKLSRPWLFFLVLQATGVGALLGSSIAGQGKSAVFLWSYGFVALLPGDTWPAAAVEHLLWQGPLSKAILPLELAATVIANAVLWFILLRAVRSFRNRAVA